MNDPWDDQTIAVPGTVAPAALPGRQDDVADGWVRSADDDFWSARPGLIRLHAFARSRRAGPWAVLGVTLARVVAATPPFVVLPAQVGGAASLNLYVAVVGPSGSGKGAAERAAADAVDVGPLVTSGVGSGEGLAHLYARRVRSGGDGKPGIEQHTTAVLLSVPEVDTLTALGARKGATLLPELRKAWSGEALGFSYADPDKRLPIGAHTYRLTLVAGVQPARAEELLCDTDAGTPQRFLWLPATDAGAPDDVPAEPATLRWSLPEWPAADYRTRKVVLPVCAAARQEIDTARLVRLRGHTSPGDDAEGHALLARLKTAAALALFDGHAAVTDEDWQLAGVVADISLRTRTAIAATLQRADTARNLRRGEAEGQRAAVAADTANEHAVKRVARLLTRRLADVKGWRAGGQLRHELPSRDRDLFEESIARLILAGQVESDDAGPDERRYMLTGDGGRS